MSAEQFLDRVFENVPALSHDSFNYKSWRYSDHPTSEGVGLMPEAGVDADVMVARILDVENYASNIRYVKECVITEQRSDTDFTYVQRMELPLLGGLQTALHIADFGERDGYRVVAWSQDDAGTDALDKRKGGARTSYNFGSWLLAEDHVCFALSSAPRKADVGSLKFALMTKGADATASDVLKANIEGMVAWAKR